MMHAVMLRRVEDPLKWAKVIDDRRVDPELINQVELVMSYEVRRRDEQGQRQVEHL